VSGVIATIGPKSTSVVSKAQAVVQPTLRDSLGGILLLNRDPAHVCEVTEFLFLVENYNSRLKFDVYYDAETSKAEVKVKGQLLAIQMTHGIALPAWVTSNAYKFEGVEKSYVNDMLRKAPNTYGSVLSHAFEGISRHSNVSIFIYNSSEVVGGTGPVVIRHEIDLLRKRKSLASRLSTLVLSTPGQIYVNEITQFTYNFTDCTPDLEIHVAFGDGTQSTMFRTVRAEELPEMDCHEEFSCTNVENGNIDPALIFVGPLIEHAYTTPGTFNVTFYVREDFGTERKTGSVQTLAVVDRRPTLEELLGGHGVLASRPAYVNMPTNVLFYVKNHVRDITAVADFGDGTDPLVLVIESTLVPHWVTSDLFTPPRLNNSATDDHFQLHPNETFSGALVEHVYHSVRDYGVTFTISVVNELVGGNSTATSPTTHVTIQPTPLLSDVFGTPLFLVQRSNVLGNTTHFVFLARNTVQLATFEIDFGDGDTAVLTPATIDAVTRHAQFTLGDPDEQSWVGDIREYETKLMQTHAYVAIGDYTCTLRLTADIAPLGTLFHTMTDDVTVLYPTTTPPTPDKTSTIDRETTTEGQTGRGRVSVDVCLELDFAVTGGGLTRAYPTKHNRFDELNLIAYIWSDDVGSSIQSEVTWTMRRLSLVATKEGLYELVPKAFQVRNMELLIPPLWFDHYEFEIIAAVCYFTYLYRCPGILIGL